LDRLLQAEDHLLIFEGERDLQSDLQQLEIDLPTG
jgi:hypothetical protein